MTYHGACKWTIETAADTRNTDDETGRSWLQSTDSSLKEVAIIVSAHRFRSTERLKIKQRNLTKRSVHKDEDSNFAVLNLGRMKNQSHNISNTSSILPKQFELCAASWRDIIVNHMLYSWFRKRSHKSVITQGHHRSYAVLFIQCE